MTSAAVAHAETRIIPKLDKEGKEVKEEEPDFTEDRDIILGGIPMKAKQFVGIGTLNVETGRGEVKARSGDFILTYSDSFETLRAVMSAEVFQTLWKNLGGTEIPPPPEALAKKVLNDKSGPDKFTPPRDLIAEHPERQVRLDDPLLNLPIEHPEHPIAGQRPVRPGHELPEPPHPSHLPSDSDKLRSKK